MTTATPGRWMDERWVRPVRAIVDGVRDLVRSLAPDFEKVAHLRVLALRWRCLAQIIGQDLVRTDPDLRKAFSLLAEAVRSLPSPRLEALDPAASQDWVAALAEAQEGLAKAQEEARAREDRARAAAVLFDELRSIPTRYFLPEDGEGLRLLRTGIAELASCLPLREELARFALPYRGFLGEAFDFLWKKRRREGADGKGEETRVTHLPRRQILERMLGRMLSKHAIGAVHAPIDLVLRGFPPHQYGLAKEALDALCAAGLVVRKNTNYGERVFLDPGPLSRVKAFLAGGGLGIAALDLWTTRDALEEAA